jgi:hypothetical protein
MQSLATLYSVGQDSTLALDELDKLEYVINSEYLKLICKGWEIYEDNATYEFSEYLSFWKDKKLPTSNLNHGNHIFSSDAMNFKFRAVHDFTHWVRYADFTLQGEVQTFKHLVAVLERYGVSRLSNLTKVLFSEIVLQAAYCTKFSEFSEQKLVLTDIAYSYAF